MNNGLRCTVVCMCLCVVLLWAGYTIHHSSAEFSFYEDNGFDRIKAIGYALVGEPGSPELPAAYLNYIIPPNAEVETLIVTQSNVTQIPGEYLIYPAQPPAPIGETVPWVPPDTLIYNSNALFPGNFIKVISQGILDGARIVTLEVQPFQYRPQSRQLFLVENINFEFAFGSSNPPELQPQTRGVYEQAVYDATIRNAVVNDYEIPKYYQRPTLVPEGQLGVGDQVPTGPGVIIAPSEFHSAFQLYADWMTDQGIKTVMVTPREIYAHFAGVDNAERIRNYITACWQHSGGTYFILGGDDGCMPVRQAWRPMVVYGDSVIPCDLYFSDLTGDWDADNGGVGDGRWGEMQDDEADRWPEVFVGRITAYNAQEVQNWVTKALHYEKTPGIVFNTAVWIYMDNETALGDAHLVFPSHIGHIYALDYDADDALDLLCHGYAFVNTNSHGEVTGFWTRDDALIHSSWPNYPGPFDAGLNWLTNADKYSVVYSWCCHTAAYDTLIVPYPPSDTCIADAFVDAYFVNAYNDTAPLGACVYLGNTREGFRGTSTDLQYEFWNLIMRPWDSWVDAPVTRIGVAEALSKCGPSIDWDNVCYRYICYGHNLFGSPCFETWTMTPGNMLVTHPTHVPVGVPTLFTVTVIDTLTSAALQYAKVCLHKVNDIYEVGLTDADGEVAFTIRPETTGEIKVTVTRSHDADHNYNQYRPSQTTCRVLEEPEGGGKSSGTGEVTPVTLCITEMPTIISNSFTIRFGVPYVSYKEEITISVYNAIGSRVRMIRRKDIPAGYYQEQLHIEPFANGVYFIVLRQGSEVVNKKFLVIR